MYNYFKSLVMLIFYTFLIFTDGVRASLIELSEDILLHMAHHHREVAKSLRPVNRSLAALFSGDRSPLKMEIKKQNSQLQERYFQTPKKDEKSSKSILENPSPFFPVRVSFPVLCSPSYPVKPYELNLLARAQPSLKQLEFDTSELSQRWHGDDFTPLKVFTALTSLKMYGCHNLDNIVFLRNLTQLQILEVTARYLFLKDISPLSEHNNLKRLRLSSDNIEDFSPLSFHTRLEHLELFYPLNIKNLDFLLNLTQLKFLLIGHSTTLNDINGLTTLRKLKRLTMYGCNIKNPTAIGNLLSLKHLDIYSTPLETLEPFATLQNLLTLRLQRLRRSTKVLSFDPLGKLTRLEHLDLDHTDVPSCSFLRNMPSLKLVKFGEFETLDDELWAIEKEMPNLKVKIVKNLDSEMDY